MSLMCRKLQQLKLYCYKAQRKATKVIMKYYNGCLVTVHHIICIAYIV